MNSMMINRDDECFVEIIRSQMDALKLRSVTINDERSSLISQMLSMVEEESESLKTNYLDVNKIKLFSIREGAQEFNDSNKMLVEKLHIKNNGDDQETRYQKIEDGYFYYRKVRFFDLMGGAIIKTTSSLDVQLDKTDINNIPVKYLVPPYSAVYFMFKEQFKMHDKEFKIFVDVCGAFLFSSLIENKLSLELHLVRKDEHGDQSYFRNDIKLLDLDCVNGVSSAQDELSEYKSHDEEFKRMLSDIYNTIFKTILYMGLKEARIKKVDDLSIFQKKVASVGTKKAKKLGEKHNKKYDYILVGPESSQEGHTFGVDDNKTIHWRRGHLRNQRYGPNLSLNHIVWIKPVLVNGKLLDNSDALKIKPKNYVVVS